MDFNFDPGALRVVLLELVMLIISFTLHEWGHAAMADHLGDDTPRSQGRVTLDPLAHIDLIGTIILPLLSALGFFGRLGVIGWAKPVMTNPANLRGKHDRALVTIAGPAMNVLLALIGVLLAAAAHHSSVERLVPWMLTFMELNVLLVIFNLLPIPPLDGSKFLMYWFGLSEEVYMRLSQVGGIILLVLVNIPAFQGVLLLLRDIAMRPFILLYSVLT